MSIDSEELADAYGELFLNAISLAHEVSAKALLDKTVHEQSALLQELEQAAVESNEESIRTVYNLGRSAAVKAGVSACHSLSALLRLYRHPGEDNKPADMATFPLARSAIEGAAVLLYLSNADIGLNLRLLRSTQVLTWSTRQQLTFARELDSNLHPDAVRAAENDWAALTKLMAECGISQAGGDAKQPWNKLVRLGESVGKFEIIDLMRELHPDARLGYRQLSGVAHHSPWMIEALSEVTSSTEAGTHFGRMFRKLTW